MCNVKLQTKITIMELIVWILLVLLCFIGLKADLLGEDKIFILFSLLPLVFASYLDNSIYPAKLVINKDDLRVVYVKEGRVNKIVKIDKNDIEKFHIDVHVKEDYTFGTIHNSKMTVNITMKDTKVFSFEVIEDCLSLFNMFNSPYQVVIDIIKQHDKIPNFSFAVQGSDFAEKELQHYFNVGKRFTIKEKVDVACSIANPVRKLRYNLSFFVLIILTLAMLSLPICIGISHLTTFFR